MEKNNNDMDNARYQKELEERVDTLQNLLDKESESHAEDNKKYLQVFHQLMRDLQKVARISDMIDREIHKDDPVGMISIDRRAAEDIVIELGKFHDKYSDKSYAFLREIIRNE